MSVLISPAVPPPQQQPTAPQTPLDLAAQHFSHGRLAAAEALCRQILAQQPENAEALHILGLVAWQAGRLNDAGALLSRSCALRPNYAPTHNNLGGFLLALGRIDDAERCITRALSLSPEYADALCNLGNVHRMRGNLEHAQGAYLRALQVNPALATAHNNLGVTLLDGGRSADSIPHFEKALELNPNYQDACNNLGNALADLGRDEEAIASYKRALEINPSYAEAHNNLAHVLLRQESVNEARTHVLRALEVRPDYAEAYHNLGTSYEADGQFDEAYGCYRKAIALDPNHTQSYAGLATTRKITPEDQPLVDQLEQALQRMSAVNSKDKAHIHFALGKSYDDLGDYPRAFSHYRSGNDIVRDHLPIRFDPDEYGRFIGNIIERYSADFFAQRRDEGDASEVPLLVLGMMRSGTTLTEQILSSHPQIHGAGEQIYWANADRPFRTGAPVQRDDVVRLRAGYLELLRGFSPDALRIIDKMPHNFLHLGLFHLCFPKARVIHCRRNPVDTCLSIYFQNFPALHPYAYDFNDLVPFYQQYLRLMAHWRSVLPADRFLEVQYEELVADQENQSRRLVEFAGVPWDDRCLQFQDNKRSVRTASVWQVRQPMYRTSVARWKRYEDFIGPLAELLDPSERPAPRDATALLGTPS
jgi:tetratricopeptide (TPR) repeat protein